MANGFVKGNLDLLLMSVLRRGPAHGYAIIVALRSQSGGQFDLAEGTIYPALHRLEHAGLVSSSVAVEQGRQRRTYTVTPAGRRQFVTQRQEWLRFVAHMQAALA